MPFIVQFAASAIVLILVASYYLLASIPFSYYHFLQVPQLPWLPMFILLHPLLLLAALAGILPRRRSVPAAAQSSVRYVAVAGGATAVCMLAIEVVPGLQSYEASAALSFAPLVLLAAAAGVHIQASSTAANRRVAAGSGRAVLRAALAGLLVAVAYTASAAGRGAAATLGPAEFTAAAAVSVAAHLGCFTLIAAMVSAASAVARRTARGAVGEALAVAACGVVAAAVVIRRSLLTALILSDVRASVTALVLSTALVASGWAVHSRTDRPPDAAAARGRSAFLLAALVALIGVLPPRLVLVDWGGSLQKVMALAAWGAMIALLAQIRRRRGRRVVAVTVGAAVVIAASAAGVAAHGTAVAAAGRSSALDVGVAVDRYAAYDPSLTVLLDVLRPVVSDGQFYGTVRFLGDATDDRTLPAVTMSIANVQHPPAARPPNIFIVVIDSMRPDYLRAYNAAATFTPRIGAFAQESIVMRRAFTQYAGTALSQPALWAGGLIQRAMYVKPFAAVNNLERLTVAAGYRRYISIDPPLSAILEDWTGLQRLDARLAHPDHLDEMYKFDLCQTVPDLIDHLDRDGGDRPIFMYSQPQNLHIRVLAGNAPPRDERVTVAGRAFFKPAVAALTRLDGCFGQLVDALKTRHLYDDSIVVLTSDHGDSYGEAGRWAHAFYMAPETLRIPLIVHVPAKYLQGRTWDPDALALLSDLTPTLYDLLGYAPSDGADGIAGRSIFSRPSDRQVPRDAVLVQSSYSRMYGLLDGEGRWLYVADANHDREEFYQLPEVDPFPKPLAAADRPKYRKWILERLKALDRFYARRSN